MQFPPYFYFLFPRTLYSRASFITFFAISCAIYRVSTGTTLADAMSGFAETGSSFNGQTVADRTILKSNRKSGTASLFVVSAIFPLPVWA